MPQSRAFIRVAVHLRADVASFHSIEHDASINYVTIMMPWQKETLQIIEPRADLVEAADTYAEMTANMESRR